MSSKNSDVVSPVEIVAMLGDKGRAKVNTPSLLLINSGATAGVMAGMGTILMVKASSDTNLPGGHFIGAFLFPMAFVFIILTGSDLFTGNVICTTVATLSRKIRPLEAARPWACVLLGNFLGCLITGLVYYLIHSNLGLEDCTTTHDKMALKLCEIAKKKVYTYTLDGATHCRGWAVCFLKAVIVNWLVCLATVLVFATHHTIARIVAMWLPVIVFAVIGYEHVVVNFFVVPTAWMFHAPDVSVLNGIFMNLVPTLMGNITGGVILSFQLFFNHGERIRPNDDEQAEKNILRISADDDVVRTVSTRGDLDETAFDV
eukprot:GEMP01001584.1.p1 GENE.GEMP01001584.1~~GEMP01001584.1.p1  ORF type:complete len:316 (+),score=47.07 GEMP01001584.1:157-1104(+)